MTSIFRSRVGYEKVPAEQEGKPLSYYRVSDADTITPVPYGAIALSAFLTVFGIASFVLAWLHITQQVLGKEQAEIGFTILGLLTFIPGVYHLRIAYYASKGVPGYSYDSIPTY